MLLVCKIRYFARNVNSDKQLIKANAGKGNNNCFGFGENIFTLNNKATALVNKKLQNSFHCFHSSLLVVCLKEGSKRNFFRKFERVILEVFGTIWGCSGEILRGKLGSNPGRKPLRSSQRDYLKYL